MPIESVITALSENGGIFFLYGFVVSILVVTVASAAASGLKALLHLIGR